MTQLPTVLAIRMRQLGDVLSTLGSLRGLKAAAPDHRVVLVADTVYHPLLRRAPYLDALMREPPVKGGLSSIPAFERYVEEVRGLRAACVLDFHSNTRSAILAFLSGAPRRVGFDVRLRKVLYTDIEPRSLLRQGSPVPRSSHESALALVRRGGFEGVDGSVLGTIPATVEDETSGKRALLVAGIPARAVEANTVVGLNPGDPYPAKEWPEENFVRLAKMLRDEGLSVVVLWGPGERAAALRVVESSNGAARAAPALALEELPGVLRNMRLVVTIDSGLKHLAVAMGVPTVTLFGPTDPREWHMGGPLDRFLYRAEPCSPCRLKECPYGVPCMKKISPEAVRDVAVRILGESVSG
jgi:ADP-heptose:LPS heptosyltransferase